MDTSSRDESFRVTCNSEISFGHIGKMTFCEGDEGSAFYYLGEAKIVPTSAKEETMQDKHEKDVSVVTMNLVFDDEIPMNVYEYLTGHSN